MPTHTDDDALFDRPAPPPRPRLGAVTVLETLAPQRRDLYLIVDVARDSSLLALLRDENEEYDCLLEGRQAVDQRMVAPYLVRCPDDGRLLGTLVNRAFGNHCLLFVVSRQPFRELLRHLRDIVWVRDPDGQVLFFRFYDPRVLREFLPACTPEQWARFFGGVIDRIWAESVGATALDCFWRDGHRGAEVGVEGPTATHELDSDAR